MKADEIKLGDWQRILFGDVSALFLVEVFFRTLIIYLLLLAIVRWLGKRMSGQLTIIEMTVMVTLGAIVSVPMQISDRGILQGAIILVTALGLHRGVNYFSMKSRKGEKLLYGSPTILVKNGVLQLENMREVRISRQQLFSELRSKNVMNLGKLQRVYLEPSGSFTLFLREDQFGLALFPPTDHEILSLQKGKKDEMVCQNCGTVNNTQSRVCYNCKQDLFIAAII